MDMVTTMKRMATIKTIKHPPSMEIPEGDQTTREALVIYINRIRRLSVCLFVRELLRGKSCYIDLLYMDRREIYRGVPLSIFRVDPDTWSDTVGRKPDTGRKNGRKNVVF